MEFHFIFRTIRGSILFFDYRFCADDPIMDDPRMHDYNVQKKVDMFIKAAREQASQVNLSCSNLYDHKFYW